MFKFEIGQTVELKRPHPMAGLIGVVRASYEENRTYLVYFNHDYQLILHENQLEIKKSEVQQLRILTIMNNKLHLQRLLPQL
ncbi:hypothetical protein J9537_05775 [Enterococcus raffinosus]|uniref:hypothetical protein n=1 Tax=Enterococcus raffinosus TaxID=71452 RepID=UPI001C45A2A0|nr:hypothetical protein [Enterococcus raffinosus]QXJ60723.1 hypothetical protein J9537_05775 [Enterococcus raffinosus]